jgi:hypothetical protein
VETDLSLVMPQRGPSGRRHDYAARQRTVLRVIALDSSRQTEALKGLR